MRKACLYLLVMTSVVCTPVFAATTSGGSAGGNAAIVLGQLSAAFSGGHVVGQVEMSGDAVWHSGGLEDSGPVKLSATASGIAEMQVSLSTLGARTEFQSGQGWTQRCTWAGADQVAHVVDANNCWKPVAWFLPAISLQPGSLSPDLGVADMGTATVGSNTYRHLQAQLVLGDMPLQSTTDLMRQSTIDIGLDASSYLPSVLAYFVHPDDGSSAQVSIEVRFADYRGVNGLQIPFLIQRFVNGSLQLEIHLTSAQIN